MKLVIARATRRLTAIPSTTGKVVKSPASRCSLMAIYITPTKDKIASGSPTKHPSAPAVESRLSAEGASRLIPCLFAYVVDRPFIILLLLLYDVTNDWIPQSFI